MNGKVSKNPGRVRTLPDKTSRLTAQLERAIRASLPVSHELALTIDRAGTAYRAIAGIIVQLRHQFEGPRGQEHDLRGQTQAYRDAVRRAYERAGAAHDNPVSKRITAAVAYWVRKILIEDYGEEKLCQLGVIRQHNRNVTTFAARFLLSTPVENQLPEIVAMLNHLASDPSHTPTRELVESAARALELLKGRLKPVSIAG